MTTTEQKRLRELANRCARNVQDALRVQAAILTAIEPYRAALVLSRRIVGPATTFGMADAREAREAIDALLGGDAKP